MTETQEFTPTDALVLFLNDIGNALLAYADRITPEVGWDAHHGKVNPAVTRVPGPLSKEICSGMQLRVLSEVADGKLVTKSNFRTMAISKGYGKGWSQYLSKDVPLMEKSSSDDGHDGPDRYQISAKGKARLHTVKTFLLAEGYIHADGTPAW